MKIILCLIAFSAISLFAQETKSPMNIFEMNKKIGRGVNIIGYDPIWKNFEERRFQEKYFKLIREAGFSSVRINLHAFSHMDSISYKLPDSWFQTLDWAVNNALKNNLVAIIDLHNFIDMAGDPEGLHPKYISFWEQVSDHFKNAPEDLVFEILNEPNGKLTPEMWNKYLAEGLSIIRKDNPSRPVIIGPALWNQIFYLKDLELPEDDRNIIVTVHYYLPMEFTHQGAPWAQAYVNLSGVKWGTDDEKKAIVDNFSIAKEWAAKNNRPMHLGEFGAYDKGDIESRVKYTNYVVRTAESFGWSWSYWQFDSDFIVYDIDNDKWNEPILKALMGN